MTWQPIKAAPKDGSPILGIWINDCGFQYGIISYAVLSQEEDGMIYEGWVDHESLEEFVPPTFWQPLPDAP